MKTSALVLFLALFCVNGFAADPPTTGMAEEMKAKQAEWMKHSTPGAGHKALADLAGKWKYAMKYWMDPAGKPEEAKGTSTAKWIMGGRFLQQDASGKMMGQKYVGTGVTGFDSFREEYQTVWYDNMTTHMMMGAGAMDAATKTITQEGDYSCVMSGQKKRWYRTELKLIDKNSYTYAMYTKGEDGKEFKTMEIDYKRAK